MEKRNEVLRFITDPSEFAEVRGHFRESEGYVLGLKRK